MWNDMDIFHMSCLIASQEPISLMIQMIQMQFKDQFHMIYFLVVNISHDQL